VVKGAEGDILHEVLQRRRNRKGGERLRRLEKNKTHRQGIAKPGKLLLPCRFGRQDAGIQKKQGNVLHGQKRFLCDAD